MSVKMMGAVWELDLPAPKLLIMLALADHADHNGDHIFPRIKLIAWKTGYSERQVQRIMKSLVKDRILEAVDVRPGKPTIYRMNPSSGVKKSPLDEIRQNVTPDTITSPPPTTSDVTPTHDITVSPITISTTISRTKSSERAPNPMYDAIYAIWKYTAALNGEMAKMLQGTSKRNGFKEYNLSTPITPEDLRAWARWYRREELHDDPKLNMLADRMKIQSSITAWRESRVTKQEDADRRADADRIWRETHPDLYPVGASS